MINSDNKCLENVTFRLKTYCIITKSIYKEI